MAVLLALLAASAFALGNVLQQKGTLEAPAEADDPRFFIQILRRPVWLAGMAAQAGGLQAAVTKVFVTLIGKGIGTILTSWTVYVLIGSAAVGFVLQQSALKTGVLAPAMASSNAVTLFVSVLLGITVFGETLSRGHGRLVPAVVGLAIAVVGIALLAGSEPPQSSTPMPRFDIGPMARPPVSDSE